MYRDAKEELKRLEEALLEEETAEEEAEEGWEEDLREACVEEKAPSIRLLTVVITLALGVLAVLIFWFVRYGRVFL